MASLVPLEKSQTILVARLLRVFRILRLVSIIPELRTLLNALVLSDSPAICCCYDPLANALEGQLTPPITYADLSFEERISLLLECETTERDNRRRQRLLKAAKLRIPAHLADIDYQHPRGLHKSQMASLQTGDWIRNQQNLLIAGPTGCGKTWIACAMGQMACGLGFSVRYFRLAHLFESLTFGHGDGSYSKTLSQLAKSDLLILDDWGLDKLKTPAAQL